jgi:hypothetical protein
VVHGEEELACKVVGNLGWGWGGHLKWMVLELVGWGGFW